jgi:hypothetical protein
MSDDATPAGLGLAGERRKKSMKIRTRFFSAYSMPGCGWFRLFGVGLGWKDTRRIPLSFSERNGYKRHMLLGAWSFAVMWPQAAKRVTDRPRKL